MTFRQEVGLVAGILATIIGAIVWALGEEREARRACYAFGYEFVDGNYFGGTTYCAELTGATRRVITIQR